MKTRWYLTVDGSMVKVEDFDHLRTLSLLDRLARQD